MSTTNDLPGTVAPPVPLCLACKQPLTDVTGCRVHPTCDISPDDAASELFALIADGITNQPRSLQTRIGPSEIGVPCDRRIGYKLAGTPEVNARHGIGWKALVGTAIHAQFADMFASAEINRYETDNTTTPRWFVEERVTAGQISDTDIDGSCDLFDAWTGVVWDWKFTTKNKIREEYRPHGPGAQYRTQAHSYGRGWAARGRDVRHVGIVFMTRDGDFDDRHVWHEPFDQEIAADAFDRATLIDQSLTVLGPDFVLPQLTTAAAYCSFCPWFKAKATDISRSCPGHPQELKETPTLATLIGATA